MVERDLVKVLDFDGRFIDASKSEIAAGSGQYRNAIASGPCCEMNIQGICNA